MINRQVLLLVFLFSWSRYPAVQSPKVYSIRNVSLVPCSPTNITSLLNRTCDQCLCSALEIKAEVLHCFPQNFTCQLFDRVPRTYRLESTPDALLYYPRGIPPNLNELLTRLANATRTFVNVTKPRCLVIDGQGYLVTVPEYDNKLLRFHPTTLSLVNKTQFNGSTFVSIAYYQNTYYIGRVDNTTLIVNSQNLTVINTIDSTGIHAPRDIIFLQNGQTLVLASTNNGMLLFYNLTNNDTKQYVLMNKTSTSYSTPHGLWYVNDSFFYTTSWDLKKIYSHSRNNSESWNESLFIDASFIGSGGGGSHVLVDNCQRSWFSLFTDVIRIFDRQGRLIGNFSTGLNTVFDMILTDNYVMYLADYEGNRIVRLDPNITCQG